MDSKKNIKQNLDPFFATNEEGYARKKQEFTYEGKTGIAETKGFQKKRLSDFSCNIGNV